MAETQTTQTPQASQNDQHLSSVQADAAKLPWSPITAVIVVVAIYFGSAFAGSYGLGLYPLIAHLSPKQANSWVNSTLAQFLYVALVEALTVGLLYLFVDRFKVAWKHIGLVKPRLRDFGFSLLAFPVYMVVYAVLLAVATGLFPHLNVNQSQQLGFGANQATIGLVMTFLSLVVLPPLVEELVFRGFLFTSLLKKLAPWLAALVTSALFASAHLQFGSGAPLLWVAAIDTFTLSLVLCFLRYKTGSIWPGIGLHALKNLVAFLTLFVFHLS